MFAKNRHSIYAAKHLAICLMFYLYTQQRIINIAFANVKFALINVFRILDKGLCDIRVRPCMRTIVFGEFFVASENLTCHIEEFSVRRILTKFNPPRIFEPESAISRDRSHTSSAVTTQTEFQESTSRILWC